MNFFERFQGVFFNPQQTLKAISEKPLWVDALIFLLIVVSLYSFITAPYLRQDTLQVMKDNIKMQERMGEENFNRMIERLENPSKAMVIISSFVMTPLGILIGFLFSSLIILVVGRFVSIEGKYIQIFSAFLHANFIDKILGNAVRLILILLRKSVIQTTTSLALFFPRLEVTSTAYAVLTQFDFFQIWLFGIFGYALAHIFKIETKKALFISYGFWFLKSLLNVALAIIRMRFMG
jgi:hypothetical protein